MPFSWLLREGEVDDLASAICVFNIIPIRGRPFGSKQLKVVGDLHSILGNRVIEGVAEPNSGRVTRRERLGGILAGVGPTTSGFSTQSRSPGASPLGAISDAFFRLYSSY